MANVYHPREDTQLLLRTLRATRLSGLRILDMGTGSGVLALQCAKQGAEVTAVDIDTQAVAATQALLKKDRIEAEIFQSDLFLNIFKRYDLIIFNPPYVPSDEAISDTAIDGGKAGRDLIDKFLEAMPRYLEKGGYGLLLVSSLNNPQDLIEQFHELSFTPIEIERLFFETMTVFKVTPNNACCH